jgi:hypothetical protein
MAVLASDDFNRTDAASLGSGWTDNPTTNDIGIVSNHAKQASTGDDGYEYYTGATWPDDQYAEATYGTTTASGVGTGYGVACRAATNVNMYRLIGNGSGWELGRFNNASFTSLASSSATTFTSGDVIRLEVRTNGANCDWIVKKNGSTVTSGTGSDTSPLASGAAGVAYSSTDATAAGLNAWAGGDFAAADADEALAGSASTGGHGTASPVFSIGL